MTAHRRARTPVSPVSSRRGFRRRRGLARRLREAWGRRLESPWPWLAVFILVCAWALLPSGFFGIRTSQTGDVARRDYVAPRQLRVVDETATETRRQRVRLTVPPVYDLDPTASEQTRGELQRIFTLVRQLRERAATADAEVEDAVLVARIRQAVAGAGVQPPSPRAVQILLDRGSPRRLEERLESLADEIYQRGLVADKAALLAHRDIGIVERNLETGEESPKLDLFEALDYGREVEALVEMGLRTLFELDATERQALSALLFEHLEPNLIPNPEITRQRRDQAAEGVAPTYATIRQGEVIVRAGDRISATQATAIGLIDSRPGMQSLLLPVAGNLLFAGLLALVLWLALCRQVGAEGGRRQRRFAELLFVLTISLLGARFFLFAARALSESFRFAPLNAVEPYQYGIPFAAFAIICQLLFGRRLTLLASVLFAVAVGRMFGDAGIWYLLYALAASLTALFVQEAISFKQRSALVRTGLAVSGVNILMLLLETAVRGGLGEGSGASHLAFALFCGLVGGLLAAAIASFLLPILEILLSATTEIKLVELANTNLPLLQRLALEAPGTFQHSLMVANLAKAGCTAIGADPVLAYTGGLYHDIGKVIRPEYFIENQRPEQNPHDHLSPAMSTLVIMSHVKDGLELAREHHLPQPLLDAIAQHHGTRRIGFFFDRARQRADPRTGRISDEKYRYAGPRPQNKVMAVLMLADGVEAASRTVTNPTPGKLRTVIRSIHDACLSERQFDETDITLKELRQVSRAFLKLLAHVYHRRIEYPGSAVATGAGAEKGVQGQGTRNKEGRGREGWRVVGAE